ncbi:hypothetical protein K239x_39170 [Planctomycetes bacterium K23_9]|uniref:Uncharacterized protein n=1 Tax=Stieleria marina TaxID=1930275 RepID=A0A517NXR0_9BACT|nr:hypothetical protein K239x_39170 [Planctomycetes bacterium K23_9]
MDLPKKVPFTLLTLSLFVVASIYDHLQEKSNIGT